MEKIIIFGTGSRAEKVMRSIDFDKYKLVAFLDNNIEKQGMLFCDLEIIAPSKLHQIDYDKIIICSTAYKSIFTQLTDQYNIKADKIADYLYFIKNRILNYYESKKCDRETRDVLDYLTKNSLSVFNYDYIDKYNNLNINVFFDDIINLYYVMHNGKKMYFSDRFKSEKDVNEYYCFLLMEQDINSPHRYLTDEMEVDNGSKVVDAGAAEGNFTLDIIDKAAKVYIIEMDDGWIKALKETFKDYKDKVVFINKYLSDIDDSNNITLDTLYKESKFNFIKMDIEGYEWRTLKKAEEVLRTENAIKFDICTYHRYEDFDNISKLLKEHEFNIKSSEGYMYFMHENMYDETEPHLVRGLIRAVKNL